MILPVSTTIRKNKILAGLLGRLKEKHDVELTVFERSFSNSIPLGINLKDNNYELECR